MSLKYEVFYADKRVLEYIRHGESHRKNGAALLRPSGERYWYQYGISHRLDGPSDMFFNQRYFCIWGKEYSKEDYESKIRSLSN